MSHQRTHMQLSMRTQQLASPFSPDHERHQMCIENSTGLKILQQMRTRHHLREEIGDNGR